MVASVIMVFGRPCSSEPRGVAWVSTTLPAPSPSTIRITMVRASGQLNSALTGTPQVRLSRTWGIPVRAEFSCPDARTIVMRIVEGEGTGSVVETHATPLGLDQQGRPSTMITEATIAYSDRPGFAAARWLAPVLKPLIRRTARQLWVDDLDYAERRYDLRDRGEFPG